MAGADVFQRAAVGDVDDAVRPRRRLAQGIGGGAAGVLDGVDRKRARIDGRLEDVGVGAGKRPSAGVGLVDGDRPVAVGYSPGNEAARAAGAEDKGLGARCAGRDRAEGHGVGGVQVLETCI